MKYKLLTGLMLCAAGMLTARAQSTIETFSVDMASNILAGTFVPGTDVVNVRGTFNGWAATETPLVQVGSTTVYTNTVTDNTTVNGYPVLYTYNINGTTYEVPASHNNRAWQTPTNSGASLVLPTSFFGDAGEQVTNNVTFQVDVSQQIQLGNFVPGTSSVEVRGDFNSWTGGASPLTNNLDIVRTNQYGLKTTNVWQGTFPVAGSPWSAQDFKYVIQPGTVWESPSSVNSDSGGNRFWSSSQGSDVTLPLVDFGDAPFAPLSELTFAVDMTVVVLTDTNYNSASVTVWGDFNGWSGPVALTNNPTDVNTNIYRSPDITSGVGSTVNYQFRYTELSSGATVYDHLNGANGGNGNRVFQVPNVTSTNVPPVYFNDAELDDYLTQPTPVLFSIDMNGAVGTDSHVFNPGADAVYINGQFANWYAWASGLTPAPAPPGYQMIQEGSTTIYTNTIVIPAGIQVDVFYKYGMDANMLNGGPSDDEAGFGLNHFRVVRATAFNPYVMPTDKFGNQYQEPFFSSANTAGANLTVGAPSGGNVLVSWLGRPGANLQVKTDLAGAIWQNLVATDGKTWTTGYSGTNGFVSETNWPATGNAYFRLVKP